MTIIEIEDTIKAWINNETGVNTVFAYQDAPRPPTPYVLVNFISTIPVGERETKSTLLLDESIDNVYSTPNSTTISINCYRQDAFQTAVNIKESLSKVTIREQLWIDGLGFLTHTAINKIPTIVHKQWEERAQFDISFMVRFETTENIETIRNIEITNEIDGEITTISYP
jgi:hypothetical protein